MPDTPATIKNILEETKKIEGLRYWEPTGSKHNRAIFTKPGYYGQITIPKGNTHEIRVGNPNGVGMHYNRSVLSIARFERIEGQRKLVYRPLTDIMQEIVRRVETWKPVTILQESANAR